MGFRPCSGAGHTLWALSQRPPAGRPQLESGAHGPGASTCHSPVLCARDCVCECVRGVWVWV